MYKFNKIVSTTIMLLVVQVFSVADATNERISKPKEIQSMPIKTASTTLPEMQPAGKKIKRKKFSRNNIMLKKSPSLKALKLQPGESMPAIKKAVSISKTGKGLQQTRVSQGNLLLVNSYETRKAGAESYLHLVLEVTKSGEVKVLSAVKAPGKINPSKEMLGDFVYKINVDNKEVLLQSGPDPFEMRAFPRPNDEGQTGHHIEQASSARIVVKVPDADNIMDKLNSIKMDMFKLKPGKEVRYLDLKTFDDLMQKNRLKPILNLPAIKLAPQIQEKLKIITN